MPADAWDLATQRHIRVGTCSWTDKTLLEPDLFYPSGVASDAEERLRFYASVFPIVEVDSTYYALPSERNGRLWVERTPDDFIFNVKAFSLLTQHPTKPRGLPKDIVEGLPAELVDKANLYLKDIPPDAVDEAWERFGGALAPLAAAGKLGAVLFQFPKWFPPAPANKDYVIECRDRLGKHLPDVPCAIEFRNAGWMRRPSDQEKTLGFLSEYGLPYVCVDMPQGFGSSIPPIAAATAGLALIRFHGRRSETWEKRGVGVSERFRYDYSPDELAEWVSPVQELASDAREVHVLMNNCYRDYAVRSARTMTQLVL